MSTPKPTPGPWNLITWERQNGKKSRYGHTDNLYFSLTSKDGEPIHLPTKNTANAQLIAAAPCMLVALESLLATTRDILKNTQGEMSDEKLKSVEWSRDNGIFKSAIAAIKKARGLK